MIKMIVFNIFDDCNPETILPKQSPIWKTTAEASLKKTATGGLDAFVLAIGNTAANSETSDSPEFFSHFWN